MLEKCLKDVRWVSHNFFPTNKMNSLKIKTERAPHFQHKSAPLVFEKMFHCVPATMNRKIIYELVRKVYQHCKLRHKKGSIMDSEI